MLLTGNVVVTLDSPPAELLGRPARQRLRTLWKLLRHFRSPGFCGDAARDHGATVTTRTTSSWRRYASLLADVPGIRKLLRLQLRPGEIFGEIAARAPAALAPASVFATQPSQLLEIRWQDCALDEV